MKLLIGVLISIVILAGLGFGGYYLVSGFIEDRAVEYVEQDLENSNNISQARAYIDSAPQLKAYISEGSDANLEELPFQTKEQATRVVMQKLSLKELQSIQAKVSKGLTEAEALELAETFESKLTDEELLALKAILYKELYE
ncbi:hypothetical protein [Sutcliffiella deserti]|uniref:hypothetical protein n=1 Tax=Sutcliffiella deserti TaxID=2875501 RepID=UPI001CBDE670|nr:hypothetical protein [Sutcliffiella deserti]